MQTKTKPEAMEQPADTQLRTSVLRPDPAHYTAALLWASGVRHPYSIPNEGVKASPVEEFSSRTLACAPWLYFKEQVGSG